MDNTQEDDVHHIDVLMPMYNLIEHSDNNSKTSGTLWQYCRDELTLAANAIIDFTVTNVITNSFKIKEKLTRETETMALNILK